MRDVDDVRLSRIITDVLEGETEKFAEIIRAYQKPIVHYCFRMLGDAGDAEDSGQEIFLKAYRSMGKYNREIPFGAWLYKIAYNHCIDVLRKRKLAKYLPFFYRDERQHRPVDWWVEENCYNEFVQRALTKLSAEERNLLILRCVEEKSYDEIGLILQQNNASLRKKYGRTADKFRKYYAQAKGVEPYDIGQGSGSKTPVS